MKFVKSNLFKAVNYVEYDIFIVYIWMRDLFLIKISKWQGPACIH